MRKPILWTAAALAIAVGALLYFASQFQSRDLDNKQTATQAAALEESTPSLLDSPNLPDNLGVKVVAKDSERTEVQQASPKPAEAPDDYPRCKIFGSVTDERGAALVGVLVKLSSVGESWLNKEIYDGDLSEFTFHTETDAAGNFMLETPLPTSSWISIDLKPSVIHALAGRDFGPAGGRDKEPLRPGENDLGVFVLQDTGAFEGSVFAANGQTIEKAKVRTSRSGPGGYGLTSRNTQGSRYQVGHVPPGVHSVEARAPGYVTSKPMDVTVAKGMVISQVNFTLQPAASISGRILNEKGQPVEKAKVRAWPKVSGQGAFGRSAADGSFKLYLPQNDPYRLEVELAGFDKFESEPEESFKPNTQGIEVILTKSAQNRYLVRDADTGDPIEHFGLKIIAVKSGSATFTFNEPNTAAIVQKHPGGEVQMAGDPRFDGYTIAAPGYGSQRGSIRYDDGSERQQTIKLKPGGAIRGRFAMGGQAVEHATVRISADRIPLKPGVTKGEGDIFSSNWGSDLDRFAGVMRRHRTDPEGNFRIPDLAAGTYELKLTAAGIAPRIVERVRVEAGQTHELGDIEAYRPSQVHGVVSLGPGFSSSGLAVDIWTGNDFDQELSETVDVNGEFTFEALTEGDYELTVKGKKGALLNGYKQQVTLARGETLELALDLSNRIPAQLEVHVLAGGLPAKGMEITYTPSGKNVRGRQVGRTGASGTLLADLSPKQAVLLDARGKAELLVGRSTLPVNLIAGERQRVDLAFDAGELTLAVPNTADKLPSHCSLQVDRIGTEASSQTTRVYKHDYQQGEGQLRLELGWIACGTYQLQLQLGDRTLSGKVQIKNREHALCSLRE